MKIAIIGTRGIPNNYGGFEQLAEYLSLGFLKKGHEVFVYNSSRHKFQEKKWNGINLIHQFDPEFILGTIGQFFYDFNCILNSRKHNFDAIINLGYTSSSIFLWLFSKKSNIITNMDGLEWNRTKYSKYVQRFLMFSERLAVKKSTMLVADSIAIQSYLLKKYGGVLMDISIIVNTTFDDLWNKSFIKKSELTGFNMPNQENTSIKYEYYLQPDAFKICCQRSKNTLVYSKYLNYGNIILLII